MSNSLFNNYKEKVQTLLVDIIDADKDSRVFIASNNFAVFCLYYFNQYFKIETADFHYEIFETLEEIVKDSANFDEVLIVGFRGCAKTTIVQLWFLWVIACKEDRKYLNWDSYALENSERTLFELAQLMMSSDYLKADFGQLYTKEKTKNSSSQNRVDNFTTTNKKRVEANTTQIDVRGRKHFDTRPNIRVVDDFETMVTKDSRVKTQAIRNNIMSGVGGIASRGVMVYLGNYLTENGNIQFLLDRAKRDTKIKVINIPIMINGQPTWKERFCLTEEEALITGKESIEAVQKKYGSYQFSYDFMNMPVDDSVSEFKKEFIQYVSEAEVKQLNTLTYISIDSAVKESETADFTGITINKVSEQNKWYIHTYREKINSKKLVEHIFYLWDHYKPECIGIEETTFTTAIKPFIDEEMRMRNKYITFKMLKHQATNKVTRIRALVPRWESGSIFFMTDNLALKEEMRAFPHGANDDVLDSLAYQVNMATRPMPEYDEHYHSNIKIVNRAR